jgi:hypothetical protein
VREDLIGASRAAASTLIRTLVASLWVRVLMTAGLLAFVATQIDFAHAGHRLASAGWAWLIASTVVLMVSLILGALRWRVFLTAAAIEITPARAVRVHLIGMFSTNFLPSQVGGDVTRAWLVAGPGMRIRSFVSVVLDRITALGCLVAASWLAIAGQADAPPAVLALALAATTGMLALAWAGIEIFARSGKTRSRLGARLREARLVVRGCLDVAVVTPAILLGLPFQGLVMLAFWLVAQSIGIQAPFAVLAATLAPVFVVSAMPVSIGGFGVREASYTFLLGHAGVATTDAALLSLLFGLSFTLATLPGGLGLLVGDRSRSLKLSADRGEAQ